MKLVSAVLSEGLEMIPHLYAKLYERPGNYKEPEDVDLSFDTNYPNLNSRDYAKRPHNVSLRMHTAWECITLNEDQQIILATNKLQGRDWSSSVWGFESVDELDPEAACFKLQSDSLTSGLKYVAKNIFLLALQSGKLQVWSTRAERRATDAYCLFSIGEKSEHMKAIVCMDAMKSNVNKAITGSKDGTLKVWDMGNADLYSTHTFPFAHIDAITGVDSSNNDEYTFATCSLDKSSLLWDVRLAKPATAIFENHEVRFKTLAWSSPTCSAENFIYLGDETGCLYTADTRCPNKFLNSAEIFDRPLRKILVNNEKMALIGDTNQVKIYDATDPATTATEIYENADSKNFVRDAVWSSPNDLYTVGFEGKLRKHIVP